MSMYHVHHREMYPDGNALDEGWMVDMSGSTLDQAASYMRNAYINCGGSTIMSDADLALATMARGHYCLIHDNGSSKNEWIIIPDSI